MTALSPNPDIFCKSAMCCGLYPKVRIAADRPASAMTRNKHDRVPFDRHSRSGNACVQPDSIRTSLLCSQSARARLPSKPFFRAFSESSPQDLETSSLCLGRRRFDACATMSVQSTENLPRYPYSLSNCRTTVAMSVRPLSKVLA